MWLELGMVWQVQLQRIDIAVAWVSEFLNV
jgi:hypothetical protein